MNALMRGGDEAFEERVWLVRLAVEFRMELAGDEERMLWQFDDLDEFTIGRVAAESEVSLFKFFAISIIEFVAMAMALVYDKCAV